MAKKKTAPAAGTVKTPMDILEIGVEGYSKIIVMQNKQLFEGLLDQNKHLQPLYGAKDYQTALYPDLYVAGIKEMNTGEEELIALLGADKLKNIGEQLAEIVRQHNLQKSPDVCRKLFDYFLDVITGWNCV